MSVRLAARLLEALLLLTSFCALCYALQILLALFLPIGWFWGGALAVFSGPPLTAAALMFMNRQVPVGDPARA